jgi:hypothetical protein
MIKTADQSLEDFLLCSRTSLKPQGRTRHVIAALRTVYWCHHLQHAAAAGLLQTTWFALDSDRTQGEEFDQKRMLRNYMRGRYSPRPSLVEMVDRSCPGSRGLYEHVVWDAIHPDFSIEQNCEIWLRRLHPEVQTIFWGATDVYAGVRRPRVLAYRQLRRLERCASLDSLACMVIFMRQAIQEGDGASARRLRHFLSRMLLILASILQSHGIAKPFTDYLCTVVPETAIENSRLSELRGLAHPTNSAERMASFDRLLAPYIQSRRDRARILQAVIDGPNRAALRFGVIAAG